eukprot:10911806-Alexandrium_andersonii.AAC.1
MGGNTGPYGPNQLQASPHVGCTRIRWMQAGNGPQQNPVVEGHMHAASNTTIAIARWPTC